jgi:pilus assembly protein Flp/PilA
MSPTRGHEMIMDIFRYMNARLNIKNERGAALVEYALLLALIAVVCILALTTLGDKANSKFTSIGEKL